MANKYIEDIFVDFFNSLTGRSHRMHHADLEACYNFVDIASIGGDFTSSQGSYVLRLLAKYEDLALSNGLDYREDIKTAVWKRPFRTLDLSKKIYVEKDDQGKINVCLKHPFALKEVFEKEVLNKLRKERSTWNSDDKVRKYSIYDLNLMLVHDFAVRHKFEIDDTFEQCLSDVEQVWQDADSVTPLCSIENNQVTLINATESAVNYFNSYKTGSINDDLLIAKALGYRLTNTPNSLIENIAANSATQFWPGQNEKFFDIYKSITGKIVLLVSDDRDLKTWLVNFIETAKDNGVDDSEFRVCFRASNNDDPGFNSWIKNNGYGGSLDDAKLLIFKNKPPKWLFKDGLDVKIIVVNKPFPPSSAISQSWINNHSCVLYLGSIRPSVNKDTNIVNL